MTVDDERGRSYQIGTMAWRGGCHTKGAKRARTRSLQGTSAPRRPPVRPRMVAEIGAGGPSPPNVICWAVVVGRSGSSAAAMLPSACLNSRKREQQDCRGDYPRISTNPRLGCLHRHRREALRASSSSAAATGQQQQRRSDRPPATAQQRQHRSDSTAATGQKHATAPAATA